MEKIIFKDDPYEMNWLRQDFDYGKVTGPEVLEYRTVNRVDGDFIYTEIDIINNGTKPYFTYTGTISIQFPLMDKYEDSRTCLTKRCHAHIFCGGQVSYIMALRMGGEAPHLGMVLTEGSLSGYSIKRNVLNQSNDRGCFLLHPSAMTFAPGETKRICWTIFKHEGKADFVKKLGAYSRYVHVAAERYVVFPGEKIHLNVMPAFAAEKVRVDGQELLPDGQALHPDGQELFGNLSDVGAVYIYEVTARELGEKVFHIEADGIHTWCRILVQETPERLVYNRCRFIARIQQYHGPLSQLEGAYLAYDNEEQRLVYTPENDYNGGRERIGMGALMADCLQRATKRYRGGICCTALDRDESDFTALDRADSGCTAMDRQCVDDLEILKMSLKAYETYVMRELADVTAGKVYNDIGRDDSFKRLYNAPWMIVFLTELYGLYGDKKYLADACRCVRVFYEEGGFDFYPIGLPVVELYQALIKAQMPEMAEEMKQLFICHAGRIKERDIYYPSSEVNYEQSIVAPAADVLLSVYVITEDTVWLEAAKKQLAILDLFNGFQPDYHLYETAIRHWDDYWFGKRRIFGDTFPHYWSACTGAVFKRYGEITGDTAYLKRAEDSLRGVLPMFFPDGSASCAYVFPLTVNGKPGSFYDPYANDQDWGLYYYLKLQ